jgi:Uma2 family endonuclease
MGMVATNSSWHTPASVRRLPDDGNRYECIAGELLVTPAPRASHQAVLLRLFRALLPAEEAFGLQLCVSPADIVLRTDALVQPDLFAYWTPDGAPAREWTEIRSLELAVEVVSRSTARFDRVVKRQFYQSVGVVEYWVVDVDARLVERWRPGDERPEICTGTIEWTPRGAASVSVDLTATFRTALGE